MKKIAVVPLMIAFAISAFAADQKFSKEERQKMAEMHSKMAACLKSDKPMSECQKDMMSSCQKMMGKGGCPMMGEMGGMMDHGGMHRGTDSNSSD